MFVKIANHALRRVSHLQRVHHNVLSSLLTAILLIGLLLPIQPSPVHAADAPNLTYPPDQSTITATGENGTIAAPPQAVPVFSWDPVSSAKTYRVQFSGDINFATVALEETTPLTQYTPISISKLPDGDWYWHVRVDSPTPAGSYSTTFKFTKNWASDQNLVELVEPVDNASISFFDPPIFSWKPVIGAGSYRFQVSSTPDFTSLKINVVTLYTTYQPNSFIANGTYYWRVLALDPNDRSRSTNIPYRSMIITYDQVPVLLQPANGSTQTFTPTFRWTAVRGAQEYQLQYSTDPTFGTGITNVTTKNTTYTPVTPLDNDKNYYWRVRADNGTAYSSWSNAGSSPWYFMKRWYIKPVLLTPVSSFQYVRFPFFSWTPVPGAASYVVEVSMYPDFRNTFIKETTSTTFYTPIKYDWTQAIRYWRVTPVDSAGNNGKPSDVGQFTSYEFNESPDLVSPQYYYPPNYFPAPDQNVAMNPYQDRSIAYPLFTWQRLFDPLNGAIYPSAYRFQIGTGIGTNGAVSGVVWSTNTENLSAAPKAGEFTPTAGVDYYWQVTPLDGSGNPIGQFSQPWKTRFNPAKGFESTPANEAPHLLRPVYTTNYDPAIFPGYDSSEFVEITPALEWFPVSGATSYHVQISRSPSFATLVDDATVDYPIYVPRTSYGQRSLGHLNFGSYYWRVQASNGTTWSPTWRFEIAAQSQWRMARTIGDPINRLEVARDAAGDAAADYDLNVLNASQDIDYWYFGFNYSGAGTSKYILYLDIDNRENSGATTPLVGSSAVFNDSHRPEYAISIDKSAGGFSPSQVIIRQWINGAWNTGSDLITVGGQLYTEANYVEIKVPYAPIGMQLETGTYSLAMVSSNGANQAVDTVPQNTITNGSATLNNITTVSEHMSLAIPQSDLAGDPTTYPFVPPIFWNAPAGSPWAGFYVSVYKDAQFTSSQVATLTMTSNGNYYNPPSHAWDSDFIGDNTYYWRGRPRYLDPTEQYGSWSQALRFERSGFIAQNLHVSVTQATPTFSWDRVEGAAKYLLQVDDDPNFTSMALNISTSETSYTPISTLPDATYYWRVQVVRNSNEPSAYTPVQTFTLALPSPSGLTPDDPNSENPVDRAPTFCWDVLSVSANGNPVLFPWKYRVQVSKDQNFSTIFDNIDTIQNCWTPVKGYDDWKYYWRVAMIDGNSRASAYSRPAEFTKQYPLAKTKLPLTGSQSTVTPIFTWTAADGTTPYVYGAATYKIEVHKNATFTQLFDSATTVSTTYTPKKLYPSDVTYYWRVAIVDADGKVGPFSNALIVIGQYKTYLPAVRH